MAGSTHRPTPDPHSPALRRQRVAVFANMLKNDGVPQQTPYSISFVFQIRFREYFTGLLHVVHENVLIGFVSASEQCHVVHENVLIGFVSASEQQCFFFSIKSRGFWVTRRLLKLLQNEESLSEKNEAYLDLHRRNMRRALTTTALLLLLLAKDSAKTHLGCSSNIFMRFFSHSISRGASVPSVRHTFSRESAVEYLYRSTCHFFFF